MKTLLEKTFVVVCVLLFASLFAREAEVFRSPESLNIDGQLDEAAWQEAQEHSGFVINGSTELEPEKTSFKVINTPEGIVLGISMRDGFIKSRPRPHDDQVWADDCIDIFIAPVEEFSTDQNVREFYHFILNADNARYDAHIRGGVADAARNFRWHSATAKTEEGWQAEVMLPFYNFNVAENGIPQVWRFNLIRENRTENSNTVSAWKPTLRANDSDNFGKLSGIQADAEFFNLELGNIKMSRIGEEASLEFEVKGKAGRSLDALACLDARARRCYGATPCAARANKMRQRQT